MTVPKEEVIIWQQLASQTCLSTVFQKVLTTTNTTEHKVVKIATNEAAPQAFDQACT